MKSLFCLFFLFLTLPQVALSHENSVKDAKPESLFLKLKTSEKGVPLALETSVISLKGKHKSRDVCVYLVGAIHFGDKEYYHKLNSTLAEYEMVLFEMVTTRKTDLNVALSKEKRKNQEKTGETSGASGSNSPLRLLGLFQKTVADVLGFEHQIDAIDYTRKNMVHCDMDSEQLLKEILKGDDIESLIDNIIQSFLEQQSGKELGNVMAVFFSKDRRVTLRRIVAREVVGSMSPDRATVGQKSLIEARNNVVLDRIRRELDGGRCEIAVFYGAAHLPDFVRRLCSEYGFETTGCRWIEAWKMNPRKGVPPAI